MGMGRWRTIGRASIVEHADRLLRSKAVPYGQTSKLYSVDWLGVCNEPMIISVRDTGDRATCPPGMVTGMWPLPAGSSTVRKESGELSEDRHIETWPHTGHMSGSGKPRGGPGGFLLGKSLGTYSRRTILESVSFRTGVQACREGTWFQAYSEELGFRPIHGEPLRLVNVDPAS